MVQRIARLDVLTFGYLAFRVLFFTESAFGFSAPTLSIGSILFPVRNGVFTGLSESSNKRIELSEASDFFVDSFWTGKVGGGARNLSLTQRRQLEQSQTAEFTKRYGGRPKRGATPTVELLLLRDKRNEEIIACAGVEVDRIPKDGSFGRRSMSSDDEYAPLMSNLAVSRKYRRRGVAEQMVAEVERMVRKEWGYTSCYLYVEERNRAAVSLYQKLGYRRVWRDSTAVTLLPTESGDLQSASTVIVCMKKSLNTNFFQKLLQR